MDGAPPDFADNLPKHLAVAWRHLVGYAARRMNHLGVGSGQYPYLFALYAEDNQSQQRLSDLLLVDKSSTTAAIDKLETLGYVNRRRDPADRRRQQVCLTGRGREIRPELESILAETIDVLLDGLDAAEREVLERLLRQVAGNIARADSDRQPASPAPQ